MEFLNKVQIRGVVGRNNVITIADRRHFNMSVITQYSYKSKNNEPILESTWFLVVGFESPNTEAAINLKKGDAVEVTGRLRIRMHTVSNTDVEPRRVVEVVAQEVKRLDEGVSLPQTGEGD